MCLSLNLIRPIKLFDFDVDFHLVSASERGLMQASYWIFWSDCNGILDPNAASTCNFQVCSRKWSRIWETALLKLVLQNVDLGTTALLQAQLSCCCFFACWGAVYVRVIVHSRCQLDEVLTSHDVSMKDELQVLDAMYACTCKMYII